MDVQPILFKISHFICRVCPIFTATKQHDLCLCFLINSELSIPQLLGVKQGDFPMSSII